jgi:hypothetical protein
VAVVRAGGAGGRARRGGADRVRDPTALDSALGLRGSLAQEQGLLDAHEVSTWENALDAVVANGRFRCAFSLFITANRRRPPACATW